ncbi:MAG: HNH endonuclease [Chloroflexi bacterium]|nr:HNH endonuclease [Chloroflexota bacterium]NOG75281.1 HNH endonuclease [Chloroflexota bacterium]
MASSRLINCENAKKNISDYPSGITWRKSPAKIVRSHVSAYKIKQMMIEERGMICANCLKESDRIELDHILPICDGGTNELSNFQLLCYECHKEKTRLEAKARNSKRKSL